MLAQFINAEIVSLNSKFFNQIHQIKINTL